MPLLSLTPLSRPYQNQRYTVDLDTASCRATSRGRINSSRFISAHTSFPFLHLPFKIHASSKRVVRICPEIRSTIDCRGGF